MQRSNYTNRLREAECAVQIRPDNYQAQQMDAIAACRVALFKGLFSSIAL